MLIKQELMKNNKEYFYHILNLGLNRYWSFKKANKGTMVYVIPIEEVVEQKETVLEYQDESEPLQTFTTTTTTPIFRDFERTKDSRQSRQQEPIISPLPEVIHSEVIHSSAVEMPKI